MRVSWVRRPLFELAMVAALAGTAVGWATLRTALPVVADDAEDPNAPHREHPPHGTRFWFEVVESFNAKYEGDTPGHIGRGGGLALHPHVALGDPVYHRIGDVDKAIGVVTGVTWDRLRGSLTIEFRPREDHRIAVGDEVWVDLNPESPASPPGAAQPTPEGAHAPAETPGAKQTAGNG